MSKARNLANLLADGAVGASELASTLDLSGKTLTLPNGVGGAAIDTEANRPASPAVGTLFFNTTQDTLQQYTSTGWEDVGTPPPNIGGITGNIYNGVATSLTIAGNGFGIASTVRFTVGGSATDVSVSNSDTSITVNVPSAIYNLAAATTVSISVIVNGKSTAGSSKSVFGIPSGGSITALDGYVYHTFVSSGNFVVPAGFSASANYLIVAGGGSGGVWSEAAGYLDGNKGLNSSFNSQTAIGGGAGRGFQQSGTYANGGSGGGGAGGNSGIAGLGTAGQGNAGGNQGGTDTKSGGGGGAGEAGQVGSDTKCGNGGAGLNWQSLGTFYAGGGGGGGSAFPAGKGRGLGGAGGGGAGGVAGSANPLPENGTENTGGGGGGADGWWGQNHGGGGAGGYISGSTTISTNTYVVTVGSGGPSVGIAGPATVANKNVLSGAGGSGVVIVRYPAPS
jgi:hypothetical protein